MENVDRRGVRLLECTKPWIRLIKIPEYKVSAVRIEKGEG